MKILFICKYGIETGMGHLIRSHTLALSIYQNYPDIKLRFIAIGQTDIGKKILNDTRFDYSIVEDESYVNIENQYDVVFIDMLNISDRLMSKLTDIACKVSLTPIFNKFKDIDILFHRTKYIEFPQDKPKNIYAGLEYTIVPESCVRIPTFQYEHNLENEYFPIAISMGGGDAANKTLNCLNELKKCSIPATFWVMLGEGYSHSYDQLINEVRTDTLHEIILVKSNRNMWRIMRNCVLCILPGGITAYESVFAGMPFIAVEQDKRKEVLLKELEENEVCTIVNSFEQLNQTIETLFWNKKKLFSMHFNSKDLIQRNFTSLIISGCKDFIKNNLIYYADNCI
jgi:spore coat polysaccharide biosynthesis predicted glycosyltransferase SpsG